jgi:hypothetical protein
VIGRAITWWQSAPCDERTAVLLVVGTWLFGAAVSITLAPGR